MKLLRKLGYRVWGIGYRENESHAIRTSHTPYPIPHTLNSKSGFGLLEVLVAAVVLAFLLIGLNILQKGNRESILRIRVRDAANAIAQDVIDSISAIGSATVLNGPKECSGIFDNTDALCKNRTFTGSTSRQIKDTMNVTVPYWVAINVRNESDQLVDNGESSDFVASGVFYSSASQDHQFAKQLDVTVKWKFKNSDQSINMSAIVR